jgi:tetratricopeptide (TPR) repeat protein
MDPEELAELVSKAEKFKEQGNSYFTQKDYTEAIYYYTNGLDMYASATPLASLCLRLPKKNPLTSILYSNRSACFFAQEEWQKTVDDATKALDIDPNYTKALFRRATAHEHLKDYVKALAGKIHSVPVPLFTAPLFTSLVSYILQILKNTSNWIPVPIQLPREQSSTCPPWPRSRKKKSEPR